MVAEMICTSKPHWLFAVLLLKTFFSLSMKIVVILNIFVETIYFFTWLFETNLTDPKWLIAMEARFHHWKKKKMVIATFFSQLWVYISRFWQFPQFGLFFRKKTLIRWRKQASTNSTVIYMLQLTYIYIYTVVRMTMLVFKTPGILTFL